MISSTNGRKNPMDELLSISYPPKFIICYDNLEQLATKFRTKKDLNLLYRDRKSLVIGRWKEDMRIYNEKAGIYLIFNKITKKSYVGKSSNLLKRIENYCSP